MKVIAKMFEAGSEGFETGVNARKYQNISKCSKATATRDLTDLVGKNVLHHLSGSGKNTRYELGIPTGEFNMQQNVSTKT